LLYLDAIRSLDLTQLIWKGIFMKDLDTKMEETTATPWDQWFEMLTAFKAEKGHCLVPHNYKTPEGYPLWYWVRKMCRDKARGELSEDQIERLDSLEFVWDLLDWRWEIGFAALQAYKAEYGDCLVPDGYVTRDNYPLGLWTWKQRYFEGNYPREKYHRLADLGFVWDLREYAWDRMYAALEAYQEEYGDCLVPAGYIVEGGVDLSMWVTRQRSDLAHNYLTQVKLSKLNKLGFCWATADDLPHVLFVPRDNSKKSNVSTSSRPL
tara:strand:+ start:142906 stop:143700 length:795 start_codon:yes stop_codon:yes gene_type:complete